MQLKCRFPERSPAPGPRRQGRPSLRVLSHPAAAAILFACFLRSHENKAVRWSAKPFFLPGKLSGGNHNLLPVVTKQNLNILWICYLQASRRKRAECSLTFPDLAPPGQVFLLSRRCADVLREMVYGSQPGVSRYPNWNNVAALRGEGNSKEVPQKKIKN